MKIPQDLPQFEGEKAIFIVTGKQNAKFYLANNKEFKEIDEFKIEYPSYSDKEGFSMKKGKGITFGFGWVLENDKEEKMKDFLSKLEETSEKILKKQGVKKVYLFSPDYVLKKSRKVIKNIAVNKVEVRTFKGNYTKAHPLKLVEELEDRNERNKEKGKVTVIKEEARKILEKTRK